MAIIEELGGQSGKLSTGNERDLAYRQIKK
jgi:hypothetical protein